MLNYIQFIYLDANKDYYITDSSIAFELTTIIFSNVKLQINHTILYSSIYFKRIILIFN